MLIRAYLPSGHRARNDRRCSCREAVRGFEARWDQPGPRGEESVEPVSPSLDKIDATLTGFEILDAVEEAV